MRLNEQKMKRFLPAESHLKGLVRRKMDSAEVHLAVISPQRKALCDWKTGWESNLD